MGLVSQAPEGHLREESVRAWGCVLSRLAAEIVGGGEASFVWLLPLDL